MSTKFQYASKREKNPITPAVTAKYYLTNAVLLPEVLKSKEQGKMTDQLAVMLMMLTKKYAQRPCFNGYTYKEDMISEAMANLCQNALKFNPEKSDNPFAYYTSCVNSSFLQFLNVEKKHRRIRDQLLVDVGENPSFNFTEEHRSQQNGEFKSELADLKNQIDEARIRLKQEAADKAIADALIAAEKLAAQHVKDSDEVAEHMLDDVEGVDELIDAAAKDGNSLLNF